MIIKPIKYINKTTIYKDVPYSRGEVIILDKLEVVKSVKFTSSLYNTKHGYDVATTPKCYFTISNTEGPLSYTWVNPFLKIADCPGFDAEGQLVKLMMSDNDMPLFNFTITIEHLVRET